MQLAGSICKACGQKIIFADEAKFCSRCETVMHLGCDGNVCHSCAATFSSYVHPKADTLRGAIVPRALRPIKTGAAAFAVLFIFLLMLLILYAFSLP